MSGLSDARAAIVAAEIAKALKNIHTREDMLVALANAAVVGKWTEREVAHGIQIAKRLRNGQTNSLSTFGSEISRACHPRVRNHVAELVKLARDAWEAEMTTDNKPCRKAFQRCYHMIVNHMFKEAIENQHIFRDVSEVVAYATDHDPDLNAQKVKARLDAICKELTAFYNDFPIEGIEVCIDYLKDITATEIRETVVSKAFARAVRNAFNEENKCRDTAQAKLSRSILSIPKS